MIGDEFEDAKVMIGMEEDEDEANADGMLRPNL